MKNEKICVRKNLMYLFLISVFAVLFVVTVNYINSQQKIADSKAGYNCAQMRGVVSKVINGGTGYSDVFTGLSNSVGGGCATSPKICVSPVENRPCVAKTVADINDCASKSKTVAFKDASGVCLVYTGAYALDGRCITRAAGATDNKTACQAAGNDPNGCAAKVGEQDATTGLYYSGEFNPNTGICRLVSAN